MRPIDADEITAFSELERNGKNVESVDEFPTVLPAIVKSYTKADYIMALHKEYGVSLEMAEKAHDKAIEYLRSKARMKG